jgi:hypothetical protein
VNNILKFRKKFDGPGRPSTRVFEQFAEVINRPLPVLTCDAIEWHLGLASYAEKEPAARLFTAATMDRIKMTREAIEAGAAMSLVDIAKRVEVSNDLARDAMQYYCLALFQQVVERLVKKTRVVPDVR